jgi:hypothetical protein
MVSKAMKRAALRNLDGPSEQLPVEGHVGSPFSPSTSPCASNMGTLNSNSLSINDMSIDRCTRNLSSLGIKLGGSDKIVNLSINALKRIEVDRSTVTPSKSLKLAEKTKNNKDRDLSLDSDNEDTIMDSTLVDHLLKDITDVSFDDSELDTRICDLMVTSRKSKSSSKKKKESL